MENEKISVLMSVYKNDKPSWLELAINSVVNQTLKPDEIVLFVDGKVGDDLNFKINELCEKYDLIKLFKNEKSIG